MDKANVNTPDEKEDASSEKPSRLGPGGKLLCAVIAGILAFGVLFACYNAFVLPPKNVLDDTNKLHDYVYARYKSENADYVTRNMQSDSYLVFGSSEFYISKDQVSMCPQVVFGENSFDMDMTFVGEAYDQSLWQAIAVGAYATHETNSNKIMIMVSPQWFFKGNGQEKKFYTKFSYTLYKEFLQNDSIPESTKSYVRQRLVDLGIDNKVIDAANDDGFCASINDFFFSAGDDLRIRNNIANISCLSPALSDAKKNGTSNPSITAADGTPDWSTLIANAQKEGESKTTSNDYGIIDKYWERNHQYRAEWYQNMKQADSEYADLECLLDICRAVGYEPLVCIIPCHGSWYDENHVSLDDRNEYYANIRKICDEKDCAYADFSSCEYEKYFLVDTVHPGWIGWVRIEEAFYDFVRNQDDAFLGGGKFGSADGLKEYESERS